MPKFTIKTWVGERKLFETDSGTLKEAVEKAVAKNVNLHNADLHSVDLTGADLTGADLTGADLTGMNLTGSNSINSRFRYADLISANLTGANLTGANLTGANLTGADLTGVILTGAILSYAILTKAVLTGTNLTIVNLTDTILTDSIFDDRTVIDTGETWGLYLTEIVPTLLTSGGKGLKEVLDTGCWECHEWYNCPMHIAIGIDKEDEAPPLLRQRVHQFVKFFDSRLIPVPKLSE